MQQRLAEKAAAAIAFSRTVLANSAAGLMTATLLGFWSPALQNVRTEQPQLVGKLNIDPASGKILDRVVIEAEATVPQVRLKPLLVDYAPPALESEPEREPEAAPQKAKKPSVKPQAASKAPRPFAPASESRNLPAESPAPVAATGTESEGWMSKLAPGALSAKLAPIGGSVAGGLAAARRAVADQLEAIGF